MPGRRSEAPNDPLQGEPGQGQSREMPRKGTMRAPYAVVLFHTFTLLHKTA